MTQTKRSAAGRKGAAKKQKTANGDAKPSQPQIPIDEGFKDSGTVESRGLTVLS